MFLAYLVFIAGNTLKQHLQSIMPPQLNLSITATGSCYCFTAAQVAHQQISPCFLDAAVRPEFAFDEQRLQLGHGEPSAGWRPGGTLSFEVRVSRLTADEHKTDNRAVLIVGSIHDDVLLAHGSFTMEHFPSPLQFNLSTRTAPAGQVSLPIKQNAAALN